MYKILLSSYISGQPQNSQLFEEKQDQTLTRMKTFLHPFFPSLSSFSPSSLPPSPLPLSLPPAFPLLPYHWCPVWTSIISETPWEAFWLLCSFSYFLWSPNHQVFLKAKYPYNNVQCSVFQPKCPIYTITILSLLFVISYNIHIKCKSMLRHPDRDQMPRVSNKNSSAGNQWHFAVLNLTW